MTPGIPGLDTFGGETYHTAHWPHDDVDFTGKRVAVIGTGSSGIQSIPIIAEQAEHLYVFQRTPNYSVPAGNRPLDSDEVADIKANYAQRRHMSWRSGGGSPHVAHPKLTMEATPDERRAAFEPHGARSGGVDACGHLGGAVDGDDLGVTEGRCEGAGADPRTGAGVDDHLDGPGGLGADEGDRLVEVGAGDRGVEFEQIADVGAVMIVCPMIMCPVRVPSVVPMI